MKTRSVLSVLMFILAVGSAMATHVYFGPQGYSRKSDVIGQVDNCQSRKECSSGSHPCAVIMDADNNPLTPPTAVTLFEGTPNANGICGSQLSQP